MKKLTIFLLGTSLVIGTALAADQKTAPAKTSTPAAAPEKKPAKKHSRKHGKKAANVTTNAAPTKPAAK